MGETGRIRWHCRRGMLELDLVLNRFVDGQLDRLDAAQIAAFAALLDHTDHELLDFIMRRAEPESPAVRRVLELVRCG